MGIQIHIRKAKGRKPLGFEICDNGCWEWTGAKITAGYGELNVGGQPVYAHRYIYEWIRGPIPTGLTIDHLCLNKKCVNPDHLEVVTMRANILRSNGMSARHARRTTCPKGHPFDRFYASHGRGCSICQNEAARIRRAKKRTAA